MREKYAGLDNKQTRQEKCFIINYPEKQFVLLPVSLIVWLLVIKKSLMVALNIGRSYYSQRIVSKVTQQLIWKISVRDLERPGRHCKNW